MLAEAVRQRYGGGRLAHAAFLIGDADNRHFLTPERL
jgi:hypothetical protein